MSKFISIITLSILLLLSTLVFADPAEWEGWEQAEETVKNLPCSEGGTVDQYLTKKAAIPAVEDLGWITSQGKDGFDVERLLLLNQAMSLEYRWHVDKSGKTKPINGKAIGITKWKKERQSKDYQEANAPKPHNRIYETGNTITLHNPADTVVAIYKDESLSNSTNLFSNGIQALIMDYKAFPDKPMAYKIKVLLKDGSVYEGWVGEGAIKD